MAVKLSPECENNVVSVAELSIAPANQGETLESFSLNVELIFGPEDNDSGEPWLRLKTAYIYFRSADCEIEPNSSYEDVIELESDIEASMKANFGVTVQQIIDAGCHVDLKTTSKGKIRHELHRVQRLANRRWKITNFNLLRGHLVESYVSGEPLCKVRGTDGGSFDLLVAAYPVNVKIDLNWKDKIFRSRKLEAIAEILALKKSLKRIDDNGPFVFSRARVQVQEAN